MNEVLTYRASRAQQQLWFVEQLVPGEPVHNISFERRYVGPLDRAVLRAAVADVVGRHETLRTRFVVRDNTLWQVVLTAPDQPPVEFVDVPEAGYDDLCAEVGQRVFDLGEAPLLRVVHARLGPSDALIVVLHHMIADAISAEIFMRELTVAYECRLASRAPDWPELPVQYADFTAWQEEQSNQDDLDYWRAQLAGVSTLDLTRGRPRPRELTQRGNRLHFTIEPGIAAKLDEFVRTERATAFMGLLAAYAATLGRVFGGEDIAVASTVAGRPLPELQDVIGMFIDQVVLRLDLSSAPTFRDLVRAARRVVSEAHDHDSVTFDQIVAAVAPERVAGMTPLAQAAINLQPASAARPAAGAMPKATAGSLIDTGTVTHDLWLDLVPDPAPYTGTVRYRPDVIGDAAAELVCEVFQRFLRAGLAEPDRPMWTFEVPALAAQPVEPVTVTEPEAAGPPEPQTPVEQTLLECWQWLLPSREFGVTDDFFQIGGDSILAIHAVAEARRHGLELTLRQILDLRTIRALARVVTAPEHRPAPPGVPVPPATTAALAGPAHEAYATTTIELLAAAVIAATGDPAVAVAGSGLLRVDPGGDEADLIRAVKHARRAPEDDDPAVPVLSLPDNAFVAEAGERVVLALAGDRLLVTGNAEAGLAERVRDQLIRLVEHCVAAEPEYSAADFPDAGLDEAAVADLLAGLDAP